MKLEANRKHKDAFFDFLFGSQEGALELYNALNESEYTDTSRLEIVTLEEGLYIGFQNDVSFLLNHTLNLYEHQSTFNPNMPLRGLFYLSTQYQKLVQKQNLDLYGKKLSKLPTPKFFVFCNDAHMAEESVDLHLSTSYTHGTGSGDLECIAHVLNINKGFNLSLMEKSDRLAGYSELISRVRENHHSIDNVSECITLAIDSCIEDGILSSFLEENKMGVIGMILEEYSFEEQVERVQKNAYLDGQIDILVSLISKGVLSIEEAASLANISEEEMRDHLSE